MTAKKSTSPRLPKFSAATPESKRTREILFGGFLILISLLLFIAFTSYFFSWKQDQSTLNALTDRTVESANILSKLGAAVSHFFIFKSFGLAAYILAYLFGITGLIFFFNTKKERLLAQWTWGLYYSLWFALLFGYYSKILPVFSGVMGFEIADFTSDYIGSIGMGTLLVFGSLIFIVLHWKVTPEALILKIKPLFKKSNNPTEESIVSKSKAEEAYDRFNAEAAEVDEMTLSVEAPVEEETNLEMPIAKTEDAIESEPEEELEIEINSAKEDLVDTNLSQQLVDKYGSYDPTLELSKYLFPTLDLLKDYGDGSITINQEELEANKNKIVNTLKNYKIEIAQIKANIGPTVTLYEIVPAAGIRISKIKNLEDDIALSLSALGIRIIAPIPGKGTIGIEVPNQKPSIVSMRSGIASQKFQ